VSSLRERVVELEERETTLEAEIRRLRKELRESGGQ
jgi:uncharacterized small protein (DUF1192 family)